LDKPARLDHYAQPQRANGNRTAAIQLSAVSLSDKPARLDHNAQPRRANGNRTAAKRPSMVGFSDNDIQAKVKKQVTFDIKNGDFTHVGQLCTFEVLCKSFGIEDRAVLRIGRMVHDIDLNDDKYGVQGTEGVKLILSGIRKAAASDLEALEKGMEIFEALHMSCL
jgi:hypothetical protein